MITISKKPVKNVYEEDEKKTKSRNGFYFLYIRTHRSFALLLTKLYRFFLNEPSVKNNNNINNNINNNTYQINESFEKIPFYVAILAYIGFYVLLFLGYLNQFLFPPVVAKEKNREGYPALFDKFETFYWNYVFRRIRDGWERPICGVAGAEVMLKDRVTHDKGWTFQFTGTETKYLNLGSYNYLGFAQADGICSKHSVETIEKYGCATGSTRKEVGTVTLHRELEELTARFLGVEDAIIFGMGFATNALNLASIMSPDCLVMSDEKNHASLILGLKLSGATVRIYKHNDMKSLENNLVDGLRKGQPGTKKPWRKLFIVTEGIFSMEGSIVKLPPLLAIKQKYKAYVYLDEAHSIGALGSRGRGVIDYYGCDPKQVDILMGTFTKSFGSAGGYIAGSKSLIDHLRIHGDAEYYASSMPPPVGQQIYSSMKIIMGEDGTNDGQKRIKRLARNTQYFRRRLQQMGCIVYGNDDSPVVPMLVYMYSKVTAVVRLYADYNIATVGVGFPATALMECRIRFCLSAGHTLKQLRRVLDITETIADEVGFRYSRRIPLRDIGVFESDDDEDAR
ncbi:serine palmitoyltransferase 2-like isoform X2 [Planococcus citri]